jgi:N-hydroxyarylamine O-acetyltransferase
MVLAAFLKRIAYSGPRSVCEETLCELHRAFTLAVPFENLDIGLGRRIILNDNALCKKIVENRRGGICYELNGLFAAALRELGFDVTLLSARVFDPRGEPGREFGHLLVLVRLNRLWIADVGFGDWSAEPLRLELDLAQPVADSTFRITRDGDRFTVGRHNLANGVWQNRYFFALIPRNLDDFIELCDDLQTAPDSVFRRRQMCMLRTPDGIVGIVLPIE